MTRQLVIARKPLREREQPIASDVADAIEALIEHSDAELPLAFTKAHIVAKLIELAHASDDGTLTPISVIARRTMTDAFVNRLTNSSVFQAGYKHYEERTQNPVTPTTDFFFKNVHNGGSTADSLAGMSAFEIIQSLPKRPSRMRSDADGDFIRNDDGEILHSGEIAGIVVFPPNSTAELQRAWLTRLAGYTTGQLEKTVTKLEHARPDTASVAALKTYTEPVKPALRKALPRPTHGKKPPSS